MPKAWLHETSLGSLFSTPAPEQIISMRKMRYYFLESTSNPEPLFEYIQKEWLKGDKIEKVVRAGLINLSHMLVCRKGHT